MYKMISIRDAEDFLNKYECYDKFMHNLAELSTWDFETLVDDEQAFFLVSAFTWDDTPEGEKYWTDLYDEWLQFAEWKIYNR